MERIPHQTISRLLLWASALAIASQPVYAGDPLAESKPAESKPAESKPAESKPAPAVDEAAVQARITALIAELGAEDFAIREKAQAELGQLGLAAFDALHAAQIHNDPEVALRARYLVRSMSVRWSQESDSPKVVLALKGYGDFSEPERRTRIDLLASIPGGEGVPALCRLARFETNESLSKYAALKILQQPLPTDE